MIYDVTEQDFEARVMQNDKPVLVDFWAEWCGPCKALAPTLKEIAAEYEGEIDIAKIDIVAEPELAKRFGVMAIPTLMMVKEGAERARTTGTMSRSRLDEFVDDQLGGK